MRKLMITTAFLMYSWSSVAQADLANDNSKLLTNSELDELSMKGIIKQKMNDPNLYNAIWRKTMEKANHDNNVWKFMNDLNIEFKTFQSADGANSSLGLSYDFNFEYFKMKTRKESRILNAFSLKSSGNVAVYKQANPYNFLESKCSYSFGKFVGGTQQKPDSTVYAVLNKIEDQLVASEDLSHPETMALWKEFGSLIKYSNQYFYSFDLKFGLESNQDFSKNQLTPGLLLHLGVKTWDRNSFLYKLNLLEYPFALIRKWTSTDSDFNIYGATFPTFLAAIEYIMPTAHDENEKQQSGLSAFSRLRFETGFRTLLSKIKDQSIYFNFSIKYYLPMHLSQENETIYQNDHLYYVMALQSSSGIYVSYAAGSLPLDVQSQIVYSLGFNYNF